MSAMFRRRRLPTSIKLMHKLVVLERFSFSGLTRVNSGYTVYFQQCLDTGFTV